jgi:hypothetical protein
MKIRFHDSLKSPRLPFGLRKEKEKEVQDRKRSLIRVVHDFPFSVASSFLVFLLQ